MFHLLFFNIFSIFHFILFYFILFYLTIFLIYYHIITSLHIVDVAKSERDSTYFAIISSLLILSSLPTVFIDSHYAFTVTSTGTLQVFSLATATKLCHFNIHNEECCRIAVYAAESQNTRNTDLNRNRDYFICTLSRQKRLISVFLFNDREVPLKSIFKCIKAGKKTSEKDFSSLCLIKLAVLFIPCNSSIQKNACSLCRKQSQATTHKRITSDYLVFQYNLDEFSSSSTKATTTTTSTTTAAAAASTTSSSTAATTAGGMTSIIPFFHFLHGDERTTATLDDIDYSEVGFGGNQVLAGLVDRQTVMNASTSGHAPSVKRAPLLWSRRNKEMNDHDTQSATRLPHTNSNPLDENLTKEQEPLLQHSVYPPNTLCQCCNNPIENVKSKIRRVFHWIPRCHFCCFPRRNTYEFTVIQPQSLMPTSYTQDMLLKRHLPPSTLPVCSDCINAILSGRQSLLQNGNNGFDRGLPNGDDIEFISTTSSIPFVTSHTITSTQRPAGISTTATSTSTRVSSSSIATTGNPITTTSLSSYANHHLNSMSVPGHHDGIFINEHDLETGRGTGVSLSVLLAHIGHNVGEMDTDKDVEMYIIPWGDHCDGVKRKRVNALRVYLKLKEMVLVWYDVVIPDE